jgi:hypothetical protein
VTFRDRDGREWIVEIHVGTIKRVREELEINLLALLAPESDLAERLRDPCLLVDVLWLLCRDEATGRGIDSWTFGRALHPEAIEAGLNAILEGVVSFSQSGIRPAYQKLLEASREIQAAEAERIKAMVDGPMMDEIIQTMKTRPSGPIGSSTAVTRSPGSSESTPTGIPSPP